MHAFYKFYRALTSWFLPLIIFTFCGCKHPTESNPYPYTPDDFSDPLRDLLRKIEQHNTVYLTLSGCRGGGGYFDLEEEYQYQLESLASKKELYKISRCSSPAIRASALNLLLWDTTVNTAKLVREHLYDTAIVYDDYSNKKWTIISLMLHNSYHWCCKEARDEIEKEMLQKQPYELASYYLLDEERYIDTFPGFYEIVKKMARNLENGDHNSILNWYAGKGAMERLASYQYPEDVPLLDSLFKSSLYFANGYFFPAKSIRIFPAPEFEKYYLDTSLRWMQQFRFLRNDTYFDLPYDPEDGLYDFINLVINHKSIKSANLLEKILENSPYGIAGKWDLYKIEEKKEDLKRYIASGIRIEKSPYYAKLLKETEKHIAKKHPSILGPPKYYRPTYYPEYPYTVQINKDSLMNLRPFNEFWFR